MCVCAAGGLLSRCYALAVGPAVLLSFPIAGLVMVGALGLARPARPVAVSGETPSVSVLVPAHNEAAVLGRTLAALAEQDYPDYEVIVIDDQSTDGTAALAAAWPVRVLRCPGDGPGGKPAALNAGLAIARGRIVAVLDADAHVDPDFLSRAVAVLAATPDACAVQARLRLDNPDASVWTALQADELGILNDCVEAARMGFSGAVRVLGNGQFVRRQALEAVGGWQPGLVDDLDLSLRLVLGGQGRIVTAPEAVVRQEGVPSLSALLRQRARWFEGHLRVAKAYTGPVLTARGLPLRLKADLLLCLFSVAIPLFWPFAAVAGLLTLVPGYFEDAASPVLHGAVSALMFLATTLAVGLAARRVEGRWRWRPAYTYALLMPVFLVALLRAFMSLAGGGARHWDKTARALELSS